MDTTKSDDTKRIPASLQQYLSLDLAKNGSIAAELSTRIEDEAKRAIDEGRLVLADIIGKHPTHLTQEMLSWYQSQIESIRGPSLQSVGQLFRERSDPAKGEGFILEARIGSLKEQLLEGKLKVFRDHRQRNHTASEKVAELERKVAEDERHYLQRKQELNGREAIILSRPLYIFLLFFVLFGPEALLNLESFGALPWASPFIAWGATILIGVGIGFAAHFHGTLLKQWTYHFDPSQDDSRRGPARRMFVSGSVLLSVALSFVYYARFAYFQSYVASVSGFGQSSEDNGGLLWVVGGSLLGNFIVYLVGCLIAYIMHDADPDYSERRKNIEKNRSEADKLKQKLEAEWQRALEQLDALYKRKVNEARSAHSIVMKQESLAWPQELFGKLQAQDARVVAILLSYRQGLLQKLSPHAKKVIFTERSDHPYHETIDLTLAQYEQTPIELKYLEGA